MSCCSNDIFYKIPRVCNWYLGLMECLRQHINFKMTKIVIKYAFPDFCLILIFNPRTTFCENLGGQKSFFVYLRYLYDIYARGSLVNVRSF